MYGNNWFIIILPTLLALASGGQDCDQMSPNAILIYHRLQLLWYRNHFHCTPEIGRGREIRHPDTRSLSWVLYDRSDATPRHYTHCLENMVVLAGSVAAIHGNCLDAC